MNVKEISDNSLSELMDLIGHIYGNIKDYSHVADYLPKSFTDQLDKISDKLDKECERRGY